MTGSTHAKAKRQANVVYFPIITQQIDYICQEICKELVAFEAEYFIYEYPSMGSYGNAKAALLTLFRAISETIIHTTNLTEDKIISYSPTSIKSFARNFLPPEEQTVIIKDKKTGKDKQNKVKMDKKLMVRACKLDSPGWLDGITKSNGSEDYADSYFIGKLFLDKYKG